MEEQNITHKHSKLMMAITIAVVLVAAGLTAYYINKTNTDKAAQTSTTEVVDTPADAAPVKDDSLAAAKAELDALDIQELKLAVAELKTALAAFSQ